MESEPKDASSPFSSASSDAEDLHAMAVGILGSTDFAPLEALVLRLASELQDPEMSPRASNFFDFCKDGFLNALCLKLFQILRESLSSEVRIASGNLLHSMFARFQGNLFCNVSPMILTELKVNVLACLQNENSKDVLKVVGGLASEMVAAIANRGREWPELMNFVLNNLSSEKFQETALEMFAEWPQGLSLYLLPHIDWLYDVFLQCLASPDTRICCAAFRAATYLIEQLSEELLCHKYLRGILLGMIRRVLQLVSDRQEDSAWRGLDLLSQLATTESVIFQRDLDFVVNSMLRIAEEDCLGEKTRVIAIHVVRALEGALDDMVLLPRTWERLFSTLMLMGSHIEEDPRWHDADFVGGNEKEGGSLMYKLGISLLAHFTLCWNSDKVVSLVLKLFPEFMAAEEWQKRYSGLTTLVVLSENIVQPVLHRLQDMLMRISNFCNDVDPRVRWAAVEAIILLSVELSPNLQDECHHMLTVVAALLDDFQNPRVQEHAAMAIVSFCKNWKQDIFIPYKDNIVDKLLKLLESDKQKLQVAALAALASAASLCEAHFTVHYDAIMPYLKDILLNASAESKYMLRLKSVECISSVAMAVGKEKFGSDSALVMEVLLSLQESQTTDSILKCQLLEAWFKICNCLGPDFIPYAKQLMPSLLCFAQSDPDVSSTTTSSDATKKAASESVPARKIDPVSGKLQQKATACMVLSYCVAEMKEEFFPWIHLVVDVFVPLLTFCQHHDARMAAISAMPELLISAKLAVEKEQAEGLNMSCVQNLVITIVPALSEALTKETSREVCLGILNSLMGCFKVAGFLFTQCQAKLIVEGVKPLLKDLSKKLTSSEGIKGERLVIADEVMEIRKEEELLIQAGGCLRDSIKILKTNFSPFINELLPYISALWADDLKVKERQIAFRIFYDVMEQCGEAASEYVGRYALSLFKACKDKNQHIRQEGARGLGVCAQYGGSIFKPYAAVAVPNLVAIIERSDSLYSDNEIAYDAAVSALGKVWEFQHEGLDAKKVLSTWLNCLPIENDLREAKVVHQQLCSMVEKSDTELLGQNNSNLPTIIAIFNKILNNKENLATSYTADRMVVLLRQFQ